MNFPVEPGSTGMILLLESVAFTVFTVARIVSIVVNTTLSPYAIPGHILVNEHESSSGGNDG